jgi:hypothetical protein
LWSTILIALFAATIAAGAAFAAPTVSTGPTTAIGSTTATVTGSVNPGGQATTWHVEYGTSTSYGSQTAALSAGSGTSSAAVSANLTGLKPGTTYHYRLVAASGASVSHGGDAVLTTLVPPDVTTGGASAITGSSATLTGTVDPNGRPTTYFFEYGSSTSYGTKTPAKSAGTTTSAQSETAGISGLQAGHTYHFRIVATSDGGTSAGTDAVFTTNSAPLPSTGGATSITPTSATLTGAVTPNGLATTWWFEYGTSTGYGSRTSSQNAGSGTTARAVSAAIRSLKVSTTYHYRLVGQNSKGRTFGADRTFSTVGAPGVQTGPSQSIGPDAGVITGSLDTRGRTTTWWFDYGTSSGYGKSTPAKRAGAKAGLQSVSTPVLGLSPATTYHYRLVAKSDAGTTHGLDATFRTTGVTLTATASQIVFGGRIRLSGVVPTLQPNEQVVVYAQSFGGGSFHAVTTVLSGPGGIWAYVARPQIATSYEASWRGGLSAAFGVSVHPRVTLTRLRSGRFVVRVAGGHSFAGRRVQLQRRVGGRWSTIKRVKLGIRSRAEFRVTLPKGRSTVRIAFSVNQAGPGFLGGTSRALAVTIRR